MTARKIIHIDMGDQKRLGVTEELMPSRAFKQRTGKQKVDEDYRLGVEEAHAHAGRQTPVEPRPKFTTGQKKHKAPLNEKAIFEKKGRPRSDQR
jgi:hypothetical protein